MKIKSKEQIIEHFFSGNKPNQLIGVENEKFLTDFSWQIRAKNTKINLSSESVKIKEHK